MRILLELLKLNLLGLFEKSWRDSIFQQNDELCHLLRGRLFLNVRHAMAYVLYLFWRRFLLCNFQLLKNHKFLHLNNLLMEIHKYVVDLEAHKLDVQENHIFPNKDLVLLHTLSFDL